MNLQKRNKFIPISIDHIMNPFTGLQTEVDRAMNNFYDMFKPLKVDLGQFENLKLFPATDLVEDENNFKIEVEMPGMSENDIKVSVDDNLLTIQGEKTISKKDEDKKYVTREINYGKYERRIALPPTADLDKVSASFKKGMLWVTIPKRAESKSRLREVKIEKGHSNGSKQIGKSSSSRSAASMAGQSRLKARTKSTATHKKTASSTK